MSSSTRPDESAWRPSCLLWPGCDGDGGLSLPGSSRLTVFSGPIHVVGLPVSTSLYGRRRSHCGDRPHLFIHPCIHGHWGCFQTLQFYLRNSSSAVPAALARMVRRGSFPAGARRRCASISQCTRASPDVLTLGNSGRPHLGRPADGSGGYHTCAHPAGNAPALRKAPGSCGKFLPFPLAMGPQGCHAKGRRPPAPLRPLDCERVVGANSS